MRQSLPLVFALSVLTSTASAAPVYRVQSIPPMTTATVYVVRSVTPTAINAGGIVVSQETVLSTSGAANASGNSIVWNGTGKLSPGFGWSGINDANICAGIVKGAADPASDGPVLSNCVAPTFVAFCSTHGRVYPTATQGSVAAPLPVVSPSQPALGLFATANAINNAGQFVGQQVILLNVPATGATGTTTKYSTRAYLGTATQVQDLGALPGGGLSSASALNASGVTVGWSQYGLNSTLHHAFRWQAGGVMTDLGTLGGTESEASGINDSGVIVGFAQNANQVKHAVAWQNGVIRDLGTLGGAESTASAVSGNRVVGASTNASGASRAFLYDLGANTLTDLNTLLPANSGWVLTDARAVNATGTVAGLGMLNGAPAAFVLVPFNAATLANPQTVTAPKPLLR